MTINTNEDFRNQFNSGWASKLIIGVDEVMLDKKEDTERIKNLSTTKSIKSEAKGKDKTEQEFYGKFILCSNNESDFIKITPQEIRFWVRNVPVLTYDNINLRAVMKKEISGFLYFLTNRSISTVSASRMWFTREQLFTPALLKVMRGGASKLEKEIKSLITNQLSISGLEEIQFAPKDIIDLLKIENNVYVQLTDVTGIVSDKWGYLPEKESIYYHIIKFHYDNDGNFSQTNEKRTGRPYTFKNGLSLDL